MYCNPVAFEKTGLTTCLAAGAGSPRLTYNIKTGLFPDTSFEHQIILVKGGGGDLYKLMHLKDSKL
jgi:hypothetical protein